MQSAPYRALSTVVSVLLFLALGAVIVLVVRDNPPVPKSVDTSPEQNKTKQQQTPTVGLGLTAKPSPTEIRLSNVLLDPVRRVDGGGYTFQPVRGYSLALTEESVRMNAPDADEELGPTIVLTGGSHSSYFENPTDSLSDAFDQFVSYFAKVDSFFVSEQITVTTENLTGIAADISSVNSADSGTKPFAGRVFMARPKPPQFFVMVAIAPVEDWTQYVEEQYQAVLNSVSIVDLPHTDIVNAIPSIEAGEAGILSTDRMPTPDAVGVSLAENNRSLDSAGATDERFSPATQRIPASEPASNQTHWMSWSNGNYIHDLVIVEDKLWAATSGGAVVWNLRNGLATKYTMRDGLISNSSAVVSFCPFAGLGVVFGTNAGIQTYDPENMIWATLNSDNSLMSFDDVSDIQCSPEAAFMVIGYRRHGIDIFDAQTSEWLHFDRNRGLVSDTVQMLTVVGDRDEIWIISELGVTVLENIQEINNRRSSFYNADNSPLLDQPIEALAASSDGSIWLTQGTTLFHISTADQTVAGSTQREWVSYGAQSLPASGQSGETPFPTSPIISLSSNGDSTIWLASTDGQICHFDPAEERCIQFLDGDNHETLQAGQREVSKLIASDEKNLTLGTSGEGILRFDGTEWDQFKLPDEPLLGNHIYSLAQEDNGQIWIASDGGVQRMRLIDSGTQVNLVDEPIPQVEQIGEDFLTGGTSVLYIDQQNPDKETHYWLGAREAAHSDGRSWTIYSAVNGLTGSPVQSIAVDLLDRVWLGTRQGLGILNGDTFFTLTTREGLPDEDIRALLVDAHAQGNVVWIGTEKGGLLRFEKNQIQVLDQSNTNLPSNRITSLNTDVDGSLLVGTDQGLARFGDGRIIQIRPVGNATITAIATAKMADTEETDEVWVGTQSEGIYRYNGLAWEQLSLADKLPDDHITALLIDRDGYIWIGGRTGGLTRYSPRH